jgi:hypothetical protein
MDVEVDVLPFSFPAAREVACSRKIVTRAASSELSFIFGVNNIKDENPKKLLLFRRCYSPQKKIQLITFQPLLL